MARQATARGTLYISIEELDTAAGAASNATRLEHLFSKLIDMPSGTTDGSIDRAWSGTGTATTTPTDVDLIGSLTSQIAAGAVTSFADLQLLIVENTAAAGNLHVGGVANHIGVISGTTDHMVIPPGGYLILNLGTSGLALTAATADLLRLAASAGSVTYKLYAVGRSA